MHPDETWHVISGQDLLGALRQVAAGDDLDIVYTEVWANSDHEPVE